VRVDIQEATAMSALAAMNSTTEGGVSVCCSQGTMKLITCLADEFPVLQKLLGEESFAAVVARFVGTCEAASASSRLVSLFPKFLRGLGHCASIEYLADIAELEKARAKASRSPRMRSVSHYPLSSLLIRPVDTMLVYLQPVVSLIKSRFPIVTIWEANQSDNGCALDHWGPETALVARCFRGAGVWRVPAGGFAFLRALLAGATWAAAIEAANATDPRFDVRMNVMLLIDADIVIGLRDVSPH